MDKLILVLYVDVGNIPEKNVNEVVKKIGNSLFTEDVISNLNATTFVIPTRGGGTRIECVNPKFVVDNDVYREYRIKMDILNENIDKFILYKTKKENE
jgi:hypothetical protein